MKPALTETNGFENLSADELMAIGGEGFAYDAGRFLRFVGLSAGGIVGFQQAMIEVMLLK